MMIIMQKSLKLVYTLYGAFLYFLLYFKHKFCVDCCLFALGMGTSGDWPQSLTYSGQLFYHCAASPENSYSEYIFGICFVCSITHEVF